MSTPNRPAEGEDPLGELGERLRSAQEAADRLVREATEAARGATMAGGDPAGDPRRPPPRGYATPGDAGAGRSTTADIQALAALIDLGRTMLPPELRAQVAELVRELLLLVRALIDWYLERAEARRKTPVEVQDIPIS
jgi:hypothetical protein